MLTLNDGRSELWQWDTKRKLTVDAECSQVHFSNKVFGRSIDVDVVDGVAEIPDILLQTDRDLIAWAFVGTAENGYTKISKTFKVNHRNKPADYVFTPPDQTSIEEIKEKLEYLESMQDPDAIKNAVDDYLANNPINVKETDPTVPEWAKQPNPPDVKIPDKLPNPYSITFTGAVNASYDGSSAVEIKIPDKSDHAIVNLPEQYDIVENDTLELFYSGILNVRNIRNFIVECTCPVGEEYERKYLFTPSADDVGKTYPLTLTVKDTYGNVIDSAQTSIVVSGMPMKTEQIVLSGNAGFYAQPSGVAQEQASGFYFHSPITLNSDMKYLRLKNVLVNPYVAKVAFSNSPTLALYETLPVVTLEGNDGDLATVDIEINHDYQYMYISANCASSGVITDTGAEYYIISAAENAKSGNVLCVGDSLTAEGTWVKEFQNRLTADGFGEITLIGSQAADTVKHEGHAGWGYGSFLAGNESNPFWNADASQLDFANYMTNLGLAGQTIDHCIIWLGWNETGLSEEAFKANVSAFCTELRNAYPDSKIMFVGLQIPSVDGLGANYGTSWHWKEKCDFVHNLDSWYQDIVASMENAKAIQLCGQFDTEYNMPTGTRQANRRNPATETYGTNGIHPNEHGYLQIADAVYRGFVGL